MNAIAPILHFGKTRKSAPALVSGSHSITYGELADLVRRTSSFLSSLGFRGGEQIGLCLKDTPDQVVVILAMAHLGCVAVPLDWRARAAESNRYIDALHLSCVLTEETSQPLLGCKSIPLDEAWRRGVAEADAASEPVGGLFDPFVISATSGSTGMPRFTVMSHLQYHFAAAGMLELMGLAGTHRFLCTLPLYYSGGRNSCLVHLMRGDCVVLYPSLFTPGEYVDQVRRYEITVGALVPSSVRQLLASPACEFPALQSLERLFCTGAPLHPEEKREALRKLSPKFHERYGTAETLAVSVLRPEHIAEKAASVGQPHSLIEVEIVDDSNRVLAIGAEGRLRIRSDGMGSPLPGQPNENRFCEGWFYPGEIAHLDEDGFIFLHGRTSDVVIRGGTKIYPGEVERALLEHPSIVESAVIGQPGDDGEEVLIAFIVAQGPLSPGEVLAHCRSRLSPHKVPRSIHFLAQLPQNTAGKADKAALAAYLQQ